MVARGQVMPIFDDADSDLRELHWYSDAAGYGVRDSTTVGGAKKRRLFSHRIVLARVVGRDLERTEFADHINGNRMDNRRCNLRIATPRQNCQHRRATSKTGFRGVTFVKATGKWQAQVKYSGRNYNCGSFASPEEAALVAKKKRQSFGFFGE